jgi:hypothetical protein
MKVEFGPDPILGQLDHATAIANRFYWNLSTEHADGEVRLQGGEILIARFSSIEDVETFVAGMALALSVLPPSAVAAIDREVGE